MPLKRTAAGKRIKAYIEEHPEETSFVKIAKATKTRHETVSSWMKELRGEERPRGRPRKHVEPQPAPAAGYDWHQAFPRDPRSTTSTRSSSTRPTATPAPPRQPSALDRVMYDLGM